MLSDRIKLLCTANRMQTKKWLGVQFSQVRLNVPHKNKTRPYRAQTKLN